MPLVGTKHPGFRCSASDYKWPNELVRSGDLIKVEETVDLERCIFCECLYIFLSNYKTQLFVISH